MTSLNPNQNLKSSHISIEEEVVLLSVLYYCICDFPRRCCSFNPCSCCLLPFYLSYVTVSRLCQFSEFNPNRVSQVYRRVRPVSNVVLLPC